MLAQTFSDPGSVLRPRSPDRTVRDTQDLDLLEPCRSGDVASTASLLPKRHDGIHLRRPAGGQVRSEHGDQRHDNGGRGEGRRILW